MNKILKLTPILLVSATLGACGGGGGDAALEPPSSNVIAITETNLDSVANTVYLAGTIVTDLAGILPTGVAVAKSNFRFDLKAFAKSRVQDFFREKTTIELATGAVTPTIIPCASGNFLVEENDADNNRQASVGDTVKITYNNCLLDTQSGITFNGILSMGLTKLIGVVDASSNFELELAQSYQAISIALPGSGTLNMNGSMNLNTKHIANSEITDTYTMPSFSMSAAADAVNYSNFISMEKSIFSTGAYVRAMQGTISDTGLKGGVSLTTAIPFEGTGVGYPRKGQLRVAGNNSALSMTAIDTFSVKLDLDKGNDGTIDFSKNVAWSTLDG